MFARSTRVFQCINVKIYIHAQKVKNNIRDIGRVFIVVSVHSYNKRL